MEARLQSFSRTLPFLVIVLAFTVLAAIILRSALQLRERISAELVARDASLLHLVATKHATDPDIELLGSLDDPFTQELVILNTSTATKPNKSQPGWSILGTRRFDSNGEFQASFPPDVPPSTLSPEELAQIRKLEPVSRFHPDLDLSLVLSETNPVRTNTGPIVIISIPIHTDTSSHLAGIAQFIIEGQSTARQFAQLDREIIWQSLTTFVISSLLLGIAIGWAFHRLRQTNRLLAERSRNLLKANQELALAAKTNAVGAITAHLIHGLKNPLSGLQSFMRSLSPDSDPASGNVEDAVASTRRMQIMINQVVNILREDTSSTQYEITSGEILTLVSDQTGHAATQTRIRLHTSSDIEIAWPNRVANLVVLILVNLVHNALQASPPATTVSLTATLDPRNGTASFTVQDSGPGFPPHLELFSPCSSTKDGGSGIGLAVSKQLANHLGACLALESNTPQGCRFVLALPPELQAQKSQRAPSANLG